MLPILLAIVATTQIVILTVSCLIEKLTVDSLTNCVEFQKKMWDQINFFIFQATQARVAPFLYRLMSLKILEPQFSTEKMSVLTVTAGQRGKREYSTPKTHFFQITNDSPYVQVCLKIFEIEHTCEVVITPIVLFSTQILNQRELQYTSQTVRKTLKQAFLPSNQYGGWTSNCQVVHEQKSCKSREKPQSPTKLEGTSLS